MSVEAVRYHFLIPMLLNEVQKEQRTIETQRGRLVEQEREIKDLETRLLRLEETVGTLAYR